VILNALVIASATLVVGFLLAFGLRALPTLRLQIAGLAALAVCLPLTAVLVSGVVMFHIWDDVKYLGVSVTSSAVAIVAGLWLGRSITNSIDDVREASRQLARGDLTVRAPETGAAEISDLAVSFNEMAANLERIFDARRELVAWASHDLRTPLATSRRCSSPPAVSWNGRRSLHSRADEGALLGRRPLRARPSCGCLEPSSSRTPDRRPCSCVTSRREGEARRDASAAKRGRRSLSGAVWLRNQRVLQNLLTNALRHTPRQGRSPFGCVSDYQVQVTVEDTRRRTRRGGAYRMFERFWRDDRARSTRGTGLGLAIARALVEARGGRIWAEDRPGGGARISFTLPGA
jgi:signal transduction histidine kinase